MRFNVCVTAFGYLHDSRRILSLFPPLVKAKMSRMIASVDEALRLFSGSIVILTNLADVWLIAELTERIEQVRL